MNDSVSRLVTGMGILDVRGGRHLHAPPVNENLVPQKQEQTDERTVRLKRVGERTAGDFSLDREMMILYISCETLK